MPPCAVTDPTPGQHPDDRASVEDSAGASAKHRADRSDRGAEGDDHLAAAEHHHLVGDSAAEWDQRYAGIEQVWSGRPNAALVSEVTGLEPGRALDVGCGEGADAVWLALHGWQVTALDVSRLCGPFRHLCPALRGLRGRGRRDPGLRSAGRRRGTSHPGRGAAGAAAQLSASPLSHHFRYRPCPGCRVLDRRPAGRQRPGRRTTTRRRPRRSPTPGCRCDDVAGWPADRSPAPGR